MPLRNILSRPMTGKKRTAVVRLTLLPEEKALMEKAAKKIGVEVAIFVRVVALERAQAANH